jgi:hypothetical protein
VQRQQAESRAGTGEIRGIPVLCSIFALELGKIVGACDGGGNFWRFCGVPLLPLCKNLFCKMIELLSNSS